jgi:HAD superfamily hydrolase (TIGR01509 family)
MIDFATKKAVLIDMDGTIVDSHPVLFQAYCGFMEKMGKKGSKEEFNELVGPSISEVVAILRKRYQIDLSVDELVGNYHSTLENIYKEKLPLFEGVREFLIYAKEKGLQVALVTSATLQLAQAFLHSQDIAQYFYCVVTPDKGKGKPAPDIYERALKKLSCDADQAVVIEDSSNGVQAAVSAGIATAHIFDSSLPEILEHNPLVTHISNWNAMMALCEETHGGI